MRKVLAFVVAAPLALTGALAFGASDAPAGRYQLSPIEGGVARLDTQTGEVSQCTGSAAALVCKSTPDERAAMQTEIDRLQKQVDDLKAAGPEPTANGGASVDIPSDKDVDKAFNFMERVIKRFKGLMDEMKKEPTQSEPL